MPNVANDVWSITAFSSTYPRLLLVMPLLWKTHVNCWWESTRLKVCLCACFSWTELRVLGKCT